MEVEGTGLMIVSRRGCTSRLEPPEHVNIKPGQPFSSPCRTEKLVHKMSCYSSYAQGKVSVWFCGKLGRKAHEKMARLAHDWYWNTGMSGVRCRIWEHGRELAD